MKLARPIGLCFFVIAALVQVPTVASATTVQNIILPSGTWNATVTVTGKDAANTLLFGMTSPQAFQICPTGASVDCAPGEAHTFSGLSGELVFYLTDQTCGQTFQSTDANSAQIDQIDSTHWTIGWDDAGDCESRDGDFNDLNASVVAWRPGTTADFAAGDYNGVNTLDIATPFGSGDSLRSEIIVPPSTGTDGYQASPVTDQEKSATDPTYINFCAGQCDAQVDVSFLPSGSQANTTGDPGPPIRVILFYRGNAVRGDAVYAQGDNQTGSHLLSRCDRPTVATVHRVVTKCVASITTSEGSRDRDRDLKRIVVLVPSGNDPTVGKK